MAAVCTTAVWIVSNSSSTVGRVIIRRRQPIRLSNNHLSYSHTTTTTTNKRVLLTTTRRLASGNNNNNNNNNNKSQTTDTKNPSTTREEQLPPVSRRQQQRRRVVGNSSNSSSSSSSSSNDIKKSTFTNDPSESKQLHDTKSGIEPPKSSQRQTSVSSDDSNKDNNHKLIHMYHHKNKNNNNNNNSTSSSMKDVSLIKDSAQIPILIQRNNTTNSKHPIQQFPIMNASALLDTNKYCIQSAKLKGGVITKNGIDASKRLLRGKKDLLDMLRGYIIIQEQNQIIPSLSNKNGQPLQPMSYTTTMQQLNTTTKTNDRPQATKNSTTTAAATTTTPRRRRRRQFYNDQESHNSMETSSPLPYSNNTSYPPICLQGHGIPPQLLQDHINMGDFILCHHQEPLECYFQNTVYMNNPNPNDTTTTNDGAYAGNEDTNNTNRQRYSNKNEPKPTISFNRMRILKKKNTNEDASSSNTPNNSRNNDNNISSTWWSWPPPSINNITTEERPQEEETTKDTTTISLIESETLQHQMNLYLTVMNRIVTKLGIPAISLFFNHNHNHRYPYYHNHHHQNSNKFYHWSVKLQRGITYPIELLSTLDTSSSTFTGNKHNQWKHRQQKGQEDAFENQQQQQQLQEIVPLLEWTLPRTPSTKTAANKSQHQQQGHISVRLQGMPKYNNETVRKNQEELPSKQSNQPVTLVFDAYFGSF